MKENESGIHKMSTSPVIKSIVLEGDDEGKPIAVNGSRGDLWFSTWADDDNLYITWGDGRGFGDVLSDVGIAKLTGQVPNLHGENVYNEVHPKLNLRDNDKPSSLLFINGRLYGHFFSPLTNPRIGYNAYSDNYGETWIRVGFFQKGDEQGVNFSPWTEKNQSMFRCLSFINMGKNYELNTDGYVYAFGIPKPGRWNGGIYLTRVNIEDILQYNQYEYYSGDENDIPIWSKSQSDAIPLPNMVTAGQVSSIYHPYVKRYLLMTSEYIYDAPDPWGPWTLVGNWLETVSKGWKGGYQPGIISKVGENYFWFTISGQDKKGAEVKYQLNLGKIIMDFRF
jgi:hypothetical protein